MGKGSGRNRQKDIARLIRGKRRNEAARLKGAGREGKSK
jgi:hypothetical protein